MSSADDRYWAGYDGLQNAKHQLIKKYLGGWFPILASWQGRVLYIDCHAGRGRHRTGHEGSPILALRLLLEHKLRPRILASTEVHLLFFEIDQRNYACLQEELSAFHPLPDNVKVHAFLADYESHLRAAIEDLKAKNQSLAPALAFIDPYGFAISMHFLNDFLSFERSELIVNFMYRYIDMAIHNEAQEHNMDALFGTPEWRKLALIKDPQTRAEQTISLFAGQLAAKHVTFMRMIGENNALKYVLIHATNHKKGRELIKSAIWSVTPDGSFATHEAHEPGQLILIVPDPELSPLRIALAKEYSGQTVNMEELYDWLLYQPYLRKHLHKCLKEMQSQSLLEFTGYQGSFAFSRNPSVAFAEFRTG